MKLHSYIVRYDSGFAPNPFYQYCTLATCKPRIRMAVEINDWVVGSGSNDRAVRRGGYLVYAMRVTEILDFRAYNKDPRFQSKKPYRRGSRKQSCGDNIYFRNTADTKWEQRDSFHSLPNGNSNPDHIMRDTSIDRVLVSDKFVYFGGYGPAFPKVLRDFNGTDICRKGIGHQSIRDQSLINRFEKWIQTLNVSGYQAAPFEWRASRGGK